MPDKTLKPEATLRSTEEQEAAKKYAEKLDKLTGSN